MALGQQSRMSVDKIALELSQSASGKINIYKCPANLCQGSVIAFQVPVVTNNPIAGSIYKPSTLAEKPIKWGYGGLETTEKIIYMVPKSTSYFGSYANKLIRLTTKKIFAMPAVCGDGTCVAPEDNVTCPSDCFCNNGTCDIDEGSWNCPQDCYASADCGNGFCGVGEDVANCSRDCFCGNGTCDKGEMTIQLCPADCGGAFLMPILQDRQFCSAFNEDDDNDLSIDPYERISIMDILDDAWGVGFAYAQTIPTPPDISGYNVYSLTGDNSYYDVQIIAENVQGIYFLGTPGPGRGGNASTKPTFIQIYLFAEKNDLLSGSNQGYLSSSVTIRNISN